MVATFAKGFVRRRRRKKRFLRCRPRQKITAFALLLPPLQLSPSLFYSGFPRKFLTSSQGREREREREKREGERTFCRSFVCRCKKGTFLSLPFASLEERLRHPPTDGGTEAPIWRLQKVEETWEMCQKASNILGTAA